MNNSELNTLPGKEVSIVIDVESETPTIHMNDNYREGSVYSYRYEIEMLKIGERSFFLVGDDLFDMVGDTPEHLGENYCLVDPYYNENYTYQDLVALRKWFMSEHRPSIDKDDLDRSTNRSIFIGTNMSPVDRKYLSPWIEQSISMNSALIDHYLNLMSYSRLLDETELRELVKKYVAIAGDKTNLSRIPYKFAIECLKTDDPLLNNRMGDYLKVVVTEVIRQNLDVSYLRTILNVPRSLEECERILGSVDVLCPMVTVEEATLAFLMAKEYSGVYPVLNLRQALYTLYFLLSVSSEPYKDYPVLHREDLCIAFVTLRGARAKSTDGISESLAKSLIALSKNEDVFRTVMTNTFTILVTQPRVRRNRVCVVAEQLYSAMTQDDKIKVLSSVADNASIEDLVRLTIDEDNARTIANCIIEASKMA